MDVTVTSTIRTINNSSEENPVDLLPEITIEFHANFLALGVLCSVVSIGLLCVLLYCCCHGNNYESNVDCSCTYERPITPTSLNNGSPAAVLSGSLSFKFPATAKRKQLYNLKNETIFEQSGEDETSSIFQSYSERK